MAVYELLTWDQDRQAFTQQVGLPRLFIGRGGLRRGLRALRDMAYVGRTGDAAVCVERLQPSLRPEEWGTHDLPRCYKPDDGPAGRIGA